MRPKRWQRRIGLLGAVAASALSLVACDDLPRHTDRGTYEIDVLALGDSFTAGNGAIGSQANAGYYIYSADDPRNTDELRSTIRNRAVSYDPLDPHPYGCARNINNYSHVLFEQYLDSSGAYDNGACTGDVTDNIVAPLPPDAQIVGFGDAQRAEFDLVTITIGGNDLHFASIIRNCFIAFTDNPQHCQSDLDTAIGMLAGGTNSIVYGRMREALSRIAREFPNAKIALVGYPLLYEDPTLEIVDGDVHVFPQPILETWLTELTNQQQALVDELNGQYRGRFGYLPLHLPDGPDPDTVRDGFFDGHGLEGVSQTWINPSGNAFEADFRDEWFHPNALGHAAIAQHLAQLPIVEDLRPRGVISKVNDQWYALDADGMLWKVTPDFVRCQLPSEFHINFQVETYDNPDQLFMAATNESPYPNMPDQPGCDLSRPRVGDMVQVSPAGWTPSYQQIYPSENPPAVYTRAVCSDSIGCFGYDDVYHTATYECFLQRGARTFELSSLPEFTYYPAIPGYFDDSCSIWRWWTFDSSGNLWITQSLVLDGTFGGAYQPVRGWMKDCLVAENGVFPEPAVFDPTADYSWVDEAIAEAAATGRMLADDYIDARCLA